MHLPLVMLSAALLGGLEEDRAAAMESLTEAVKLTNEACGSTLTATYDFKSEPADKPSYQGPSYCKGVVEGVRSACSSQLGKALIASNLKTIGCRYLQGASKHPSVMDEFAGPVLTVTDSKVDAAFDWNSANLDSGTSSFLIKKWKTADQNGPISIEDKEAIARGRAEFAAALTSLNEKCKSNIAASYDFPSEKGKAPNPAWQGYLYCRNAMVGLGSACDDLKKHSVAKVKKLECAYEAGVGHRTELQPNGGPTRSLANGVIRFTYDWETANIEAEVRGWAMSKLK